MTIEELLELPAADIARLTDAELAAHLRKYFPATRPSSRIDNALAVMLDNKTAAAPANSAIAAMERRAEEEFERRKKEQQGKQITFPGLKIKTK